MALKGRSDEEAEIVPVENTITNSDEFLSYLFINILRIHSHVIYCMFLPYSG